MDPTNIIDYSYSDFQLGVADIAKQIEQSGFKPDYLVGIVRGGSVPAVYLSHRLKVPVQMVTWNTRDDTIFGNESNTWIPEDIHKGARVIIVDDIVDGGETIRELLEDWHQSTAGLGELPMENIRIASLWYNTSQDVTVDFYHLSIDRKEDQRWVVFPWEA